MRSKEIGLRIARQRYPNHAVLIEEPFIYLLPHTGEVIDVRFATLLAEVVLDCSGETPTIVRRNPSDAVIAQIEEEFTALGKLITKKYFRDKYQNKPEPTDDLPDSDPTT